MEKKHYFFLSGITRLDTVNLSPEMLSYTFLPPANKSKSSRIVAVVVSGDQIHGATASSVVVPPPRPEMTANQEGKEG